MRVHINTSRPNSLIPFDHIPQLVGAIHKWLGENNPWHGQTSLSSFSWLQGGRKENGGLNFHNGARFFVSSHDDDFIKCIIKGAMADPEMFSSMTVQDIQIRETPIFHAGQEVFSVASPVLVKRKIGGRFEHCLFDDPSSEKEMTKTMITKLNKAGIKSEGVSVAFDQRYAAGQTKLVNYNGIKSRASVCPITIKGSPEQLAFAWNVGVGNSTGIGFGALN